MFVKTWWMEEQEKEMKIEEEKIISKEKNYGNFKMVNMLRGNYVKILSFNKVASLVSVPLLIILNNNFIT